MGGGGGYDSGEAPPNLKHPAQHGCHPLGPAGLSECGTDAVLDRGRGFRGRFGSDGVWGVKARRDRRSSLRSRWAWAARTCTLDHGLCFNHRTNEKRESKAQHRNIATRIKLLFPPGPDWPRLQGHSQIIHEHPILTHCHRRSAASVPPSLRRVSPNMQALPSNDTTSGPPTDPHAQLSPHPSLLPCVCGAFLDPKLQHTHPPTCTNK